MNASTIMIITGLAAVGALVSAFLGRRGYRPNQPAAVEKGRPRAMRSR